MVRSEVPPLHFLEFLYELLKNGLTVMYDVYYRVYSSCMEKGSVWVRTQQPATAALFVYPYCGEWAGLRYVPRWPPVKHKLHGEPQNALTQL